MLNLRRAAIRPYHGHNVESASPIVKIMLHEEIVGGVFDPSPLVRANRFLRILGLIARTRLHLDEHDRPTLTADQVDLAGRAAVVLGKHAIFSARQKAKSQALTALAQCMTPITPRCSPAQAQQWPQSVS